MFRPGIGKRHIQDFVVGVRLQPPSVPVAGSSTGTARTLGGAQSRLAMFQWRYLALSVQCRAKVLERILPYPAVCLGGQWPATYVEDLFQLSPSSP